MNAAGVTAMILISHLEGELREHRTEGTPCLPSPVSSPLPGILSALHNGLVGE